MRLRLFVPSCITLVVRVVLNVVYRLLLAVLGVLKCRPLVTALQKRAARRGIMLT